MVIGFTQAAHTYQPDYTAAGRTGANVPGILVRFTCPDDVRWRFYAGYQSRLFEDYSPFASPGTVLGSRIVAGGIVWATHYRSEWEYFLEDGTQLTIIDTAGTISLENSGTPVDSGTRIIVQRTAHMVTILDFIAGTHIIPPVWMSDADSQVQYLVRIQSYFGGLAYQNFEVVSRWTENMMPVGASQAKILGEPTALQFNETLRLLNAWVAAGQPT